MTSNDRVERAPRSAATRAPGSDADGRSARTDGWATLVASSWQRWRPGVVAGYLLYGAREHAKVAAILCIVSSFDKTVSNPPLRGSDVPYVEFKPNSIA